MTISFEIAREHMGDWPPFSDGCPHCVFDGTVVPFATITSGDSLTAFYHHGRCGHRWSTNWGAQWSHTWQRVVTGTTTSALPRAARTLRSLPAQRDNGQGHPA